MSSLDQMIALLEALSVDSNIAFIVSFVLILISFTLFYQRRKYSIFFLFLAGISIGLGFALIDPFFHFWDEKPHALVAKNLAETPFHPRLLNSDLVNYYYTNWINNYTWLHKPPLALWQMALSIKLFGASVLAVRIPSILLHALTSVLVYRIGVSVFSRNIGYFGALAYLLTNYNLELVAGVHTADHIDTSFTFYITASIWAFIKYQKSKETKWVYLIGVFVGLAILTKWLVGLLVFSGLATGPHVCYRFWVNGKQVDHRALKFPPSTPMKEEKLPEYLEYIEPIKEKLDKAKITEYRSPEMEG